MVKLAMNPKGDTAFKIHRAIAKTKVNPNAPLDKSST